MREHGTINLTAPAAISIRYGTCMGLIFGMCLYLLRGLLLEELCKVGEKGSARASEGAYTKQCRSLWTALRSCLYVS